MKLWKVSLPLGLTCSLVEQLQMKTCSCYQDLRINSCRTNLLLKIPNWNRRPSQTFSRNHEKMFSIFEKPLTCEHCDKTFNSFMHLQSAKAKCIIIYWNSLFIYNISWFLSWNLTVTAKSCTSVVIYRVKYNTKPQTIFKKSNPSIVDNPSLVDNFALTKKSTIEGFQCTSLMCIPLQNWRYYGNGYIHHNTNKPLLYI